MREYIVMKSSHRASNGKFINVLTYSPETTLAKSHNGTYRYYHKGDLVWMKKGDDELYNAILDGSFYLLDFDEQLEKYPMFAFYDKNCYGFD